jgi:tetratricopeptide (TPR) repeat protein
LAKQTRYNPPSFLHKYYKILLPAIIIVATVIVYSNSFDCSFQLDDNHVINNNPRIESFDHFLKWQTWSRLPFNRSFAYLTVAINYAIHGYDVWGYHFVNLLIHLIAAVTAFFFILKLFQTPILSNKYRLNPILFISFFSAVFFALHPVQTQAVTYITQRMASLAAMFYFLSMLAYVSARVNLIDQNKRIAVIQFIMLFISFVFGVYSKATIFTLPIALIAIEWLFFRNEKGLINKKYLVTVASLMLIVSIAFLATRGFPSQKTDLTPLQYFYTQLNVLLTYLRLALLPYGLRLFYSFPPSLTPFELNTILSFIVIAGLIIAGFILRKKYVLISFGILFFFITQIIESSFFPLEYVIFEYRIYPALLGVGLLLSIAAYNFPKLEFRNKVLVLSLIIAVYGVLTYQRNFDWKEPEILWADNAEKEPSHPGPYNHAGTHFLISGNSQKALEYFNKSIELDSNYAEPYSHRGVLFARKGILGKALNDAKRAVHLDNENALFQNNLGYVYNVRHEIKNAIFYLRNAVKLEPTYHNAWDNLSTAYQDIGEYDSSLYAVNKAIELNPQKSKYYNGRGNVYFAIKQKENALNDFNKAVELDKQNYKAINNIGIVYSSSSRFSEAVKFFNSAIAIYPNYADAYFNRCFALYSLGNRELAMKDLQKCLQIDPSHFKANHFRNNMLQNNSI